MQAWCVLRGPFEVINVYSKLAVLHEYGWHEVRWQRTKGVHAWRSTRKDNRGTAPHVEEDHAARRRLAQPEAFNPPRTAAVMAPHAAAARAGGRRLTCTATPSSASCARHSGGTPFWPRVRFGARWAGAPRVISDCHFTKTGKKGAEYDRKPGIKWLSCTEK